MAFCRTTCSSGVVVTRIGIRMVGICTRLTAWTRACYICASTGTSATIRFQRISNDRKPFLQLFHGIPSFRQF